MIDLLQHFKSAASTVTVTSSNIWNIHVYSSVISYHWTPATL